MNLVIKTVQYNLDDVDTKIVYSVRYTGFDIGFYRIEILKNFESLARLTTSLLPNGTNAIKLIEKATRQEHIGKRKIIF